MSTLDFTTALGRLLRDGRLRDDFARAPEAVADALAIDPVERPDFLELAPEELEVQARVLLRKRYDVVKEYLPSTCRQLGQQAWSCFQEFGRQFWPAGGEGAADAAAFAAFIRQNYPSASHQVELNRWRFAISGRRIWAGFVRDLDVGDTRKRGMQILIRTAPGVCREFHFYLAL